MQDLPRVALFGGAFNPVHKGHLALAGEIWSRFHLSGLLFVPTGLPPHKDLQGDPGPRHRILMLREAIRGRTGWQVLTNEIERPGKSYTVNTLAELNLPERPWLLVGADAFLGFMDWKDPAGILARADLLVASRPGIPFGNLRPVIEGIFALTGGPLDPRLLEDLSLLDADAISLCLYSLGDPPLRLCLVRVSTPDLSSTMIRATLSKPGGILSVQDETLPATVKSYIVEKELFGEE